MKTIGGGGGWGVEKQVSGLQKSIKKKSGKTSVLGVRAYLLKENPFKTIVEKRRLHSYRCRGRAKEEKDLRGIGKKPNHKRQGTRH